MSPIVALVLSLLPVVLDWLVKLLEQKAGEIAGTDNPAADAHALLTAALDATPYRRPFRRGLIRLLRDLSPKAAGEGLSPDERDEIAAHVGAAESE